MMLGEGEVFAGYTIVRKLGGGGMGDVYLAKHPRLPRQDALKVLRQEISTDEDFRRRFIREADLAAALTDPHIVTVYDRGDSNGQLWIATQYIAGPDAAQLLRSSYPAGMPVADATTIVTAIAGALDHAHSQGLVHRDIKPANILLSEPDRAGRRHIYLADFGIARPFTDANGLTPITATDTTLGTFAYSAPEQIMGEDLDGRADQYALAATAYELLTGTTIFPVSNAAAVIGHQLSTIPPSLVRAHPELAALDPVLGAALAKKPSDRFATCTDFARAFAEQARAGAPEPSAPTAPAPIPPKSPVVPAVLKSPAAPAAVLKSPVVPAAVLKPPAAPTSLLKSPAAPAAVSKSPVVPAPVSKSPVEPASRFSPPVVLKPLSKQQHREARYPTGRNALVFGSRRDDDEPVGDRPPQKATRRDANGDIIPNYGGPPRPQQTDNHGCFFGAVGLICAGVLLAVILGVTMDSGGDHSGSSAAPGALGSTVGPRGGAGQLPAFKAPAGLGADCQYPPAQNASKLVEGPTSGKVSTDPATVSASMSTDQGNIGLLLANAEAPCTVNSFVSLVQKGFFDGTVCHRLTTAQGLGVLQCGDPTGTGTGGPGYSFVNEYPTDQYPKDDPALQDPVLYPRGTLAMANAGPDTNGSQFFLVYKDSRLPPSYTVFGTVDTTGLATLDKIATTGVAGGGEDGRPATDVMVKSIQLD